MKYFRTFLFALQTEMQYRANLVMWFVVGAIGPLTMVMVWFAILGEKSSIGGYTKGDFVIYYLLMTFVSNSIIAFTIRYFTLIWQVSKYRAII